MSKSEIQKRVHEITTKKITSGQHGPLCSPTHSIIHVSGVGTAEKVTRMPRFNYETGVIELHPSQLHGANREYVDSPSHFVIFVSGVATAESGT